MLLRTRNYIDADGFVHCPACGQKTRQKARHNAWAVNLPLFCPKCKCESLVNIEGGEVIVKPIDLEIRQ